MLLAIMAINKCLKTQLSELPPIKGKFGAKSVEPEFAENICKRLAHGQSVHALSRELALPLSTVILIRDEHPELMRQEREHLKSMLSAVAVETARLLSEKLDDIPAEKLANTLSSTINSMQALASDTSGQSISGSGSIKQIQASSGNIIKDILKSLKHQDVDITVKSPCVDVNFKSSQTIESAEVIDV